MTPLINFEDSGIRCTTHNGEPYYSVIDVIGAVTGSPDPKRYWSDMKRREKAEAVKEGLKIEPYAFCVQLKMKAPDGKMRLTDAANTEGLFRILQSVPSPKVEPFKRWLAQVGRERLEETANPELAGERVRERYKQMGYPDEWIDLRMRGVATRNELTAEWDKRGADGKDYGLLTALISKGTFGITPGEHKETKSLQKENLRDHMTRMELLLTELGEMTAKQLHEGRDSHGKRALERDAHEAGDIAGNTRKAIEDARGRHWVRRTYRVIKAETTTGHSFTATNR